MRQLSKRRIGRGGKRPGAGRPPENREPTVLVRMRRSAADIVRDHAKRKTLSITDAATELISGAAQGERMTVLTYQIYALPAPRRFVATYGDAVIAAADTEDAVRENAEAWFDKTMEDISARGGAVGET